MYIIFYSQKSPSLQLIAGTKASKHKTHLQNCIQAQKNRSLDAMLFFFYVLKRCQESRAIFQHKTVIYIKLI